MIRAEFLGLIKTTAEADRAAENEVERELRYVAGILLVSRRRRDGRCARADRPVPSFGASVERRWDQVS